MGIALFLNKSEKYASFQLPNLLFHLIVCLYNRACTDIHVPKIEQLKIFGFSLESVFLNE